MSDYDARVLDDMGTWATNSVRLVVRQRREWPGAAYLMSDGTWAQPADGAQLDPEKVGVVIPAAALDAILEAIERHRGVAGDAATEARVLREWLTVERGRVDAFLEQRAES